MNSVLPAKPSNSELVSSTEALRALVNQMSQCRRIALDTEFMQGEFYKPILALIQVALEDGSVHLIDPLALKDLSLLAPIWADEKIVKVLHDPIQDLALLHRDTQQTFTNVFDTRLAGQLLSLGQQASLSDYVQWLTGESLDKGPRRSDWLARPLSKSQLYYASNDVIYLLEMHQRMIEHAQKIGRHDWVIEDMRRFDDPASYALFGDPVAQMLKMDDARALKPRKRAVLVQITRWREEMAEMLDIPTRHLLTPGQMLHLAKKMPTTRWAVRSICPEVSPFARHIADQVKAGLAQSGHSHPALPPRRRRLTKHQRKCRRLLRDAVELKAEELDIPVMHLARKSDLDALAGQANVADLDCLSGWRADVIGHDLQQIRRDFYQQRAESGAP